MAQRPSGGCQRNAHSKNVCKACLWFCVMRAATSSERWKALRRRLPAAEKAGAPKKLSIDLHLASELVTKSLATRQIVSPLQQRLKRLSQTNVQ